MSETATIQDFQTLLDLFSTTYPQFQNVQITISEENNTKYVARYVGVGDGEFITKGKNKFLNIRPTEIILTQMAMKQSKKDSIFIFIHECSHGITPQVRRKVKKNYVRIDHSRLFYENFQKLLEIAYDGKLIDYKVPTIKELMRKDERKQNYKNDMKIYGF